MRHREGVSELTAVLLLLHTRAGTVDAAGVGALRGHRGQQGITRGHRRQAVPYQILHVTAPGGPIGTRVPAVCRPLVEGDGAVVEVQRGRRGHVGTQDMLVEIRGAVAEDGLLFNGSAYQVRCADGRGSNHCKTVGTGLDFQLLDDYRNKENMILKTYCKSHSVCFCFVGPPTNRGRRATIN